MPWNPGRSMAEIERLRKNPNYMPTPVHGVFWVPERDSLYPLKSAKEYHAENLRELRIMSAEAGMPLLLEQEAAAARLRQRPINDALPEPITPDEPRSVKIMKVKVEPTPKSTKPKTPDGYMTISTLAEMWEMQPSECRAALRNSDMVKPAYGWAFAPNEIDKIAKICGVK